MYVQGFYLPKQCFVKGVFPYFKDINRLENEKTSYERLLILFLTFKGRFDYSHATPKWFVINFDLFS